MNTILASAAIWPFLAAGLGLLAAFQASLYWASLSSPAPSNKASKRKQTLLLMLVLAAALVGLYVSKGNPQALLPADEAKFEASMKNSIQQLAARLRSSPKDEEAWLMLARSQTAMGRYAEAAQAYEQAKGLAWSNPSLLVAWTEVRLLANERQFDARTQELIGQAAILAPNHPEVLLLVGLEALDRGDHPAARAALLALRGHYPAGSPDLEAVETALATLK